LQKGDRNIKRNFSPFFKGSTRRRRDEKKLNQPTPSLPNFREGVKNIDERERKSLP
jgi:hypothetical protein